jgi:TPR repeat protein
MGEQRRAPNTTIAAWVAVCWLAAAPVCGAADSALDALRKSAEQGDVQAALRLATTYDAGIGVSRDDSEAAKWYEQAARRGDPDAQYHLGILYREGRGVLKDVRRAYAWFNLAASNAAFLDRDDAASYRDEAAKGMDAADLEKAKEWSRSWQASGGSPAAPAPADR